MEFSYTEVLMRGSFKKMRVKFAEIIYNLRNADIVYTTIAEPIGYMVVP